MKIVFVEVETTGQHKIIVAQNLKKKKKQVEVFDTILRNDLSRSIARSSFTHRATKMKSRSYSSSLDIVDFKARMSFHQFIL